MMMKELLPSRILHKPDPAHHQTSRLPKPPPTPHHPLSPPIPAKEEKRIQPFIT